jgi:ATPase subunit of ABC transporter with duplicated ATPase domains
MTQFTDSTTLMPGGLADLEAFDELARERAARATAEQTAADLAELIARENARVADAKRQIADLKALVAVQSERADKLQQELTHATFYRCEDVVPLTRWEALKVALRG